MEKMEALELCKKHVYRYVRVQTNEGVLYDGIVENVDEENLYLAVPYCEMTMQDVRQLSQGYWPGYPGYGPGPGYPGYGPVYPGPGYPGYPGYPHPRPRRRFQRVILPLTALLALSLLPYY